MDQAEGMQQSITPSEIPAQAQGVPEEKVLKQSEVNELIGRIKHEAYSKGLREAQMAAQPMQAPQGQNMGGMPQLTEEQVRQMIADEAQKQNQFAAAQKTLSSFSDQMKAGKGKYSDFDETVANLGDMKNLLHVVELATDTGIAGDVMFELGKNPSKVASLTTLAYINPQLAKIEMKRLADSIIANEQGSQTPNAAEPLSQIRHSSTVGKDNGSNSVRDLRKRSWAKG